MHWVLALVIAIFLVQALPGGAFGIGWMAVTMAILFLSILLHELAHCWMAVRLGGHADEIVMGPLGGVSYIGHTGSSRDEIKIAGIGPLTNFALAGACVASLVLSGAAWTWDILNPFSAWWGVTWTMTQLFLVHAARINVILGLFNLVVPAYPLDGGRILFGVLTIRYGRTRGALMSASIAIPVGFALAVCGFAMGDIFLGLIGVSVIFDAYQLRRLAQMGELEAHPMFGSASEFEYMPERPRKAGFFARWRQRRAQKLAFREEEKQSRLRERVDTILEKVSREGIGSLSAAERRILDEASRRSRDDE
jgi:Zn-dependent protease